jgi:uncharacterized membrane protein
MRTWYFPVVSVLLLVLSVIAFSDNLFTDVGQPSNSDPKFIIHGLFCLAWFTTFVAQSLFIRRRSVAAHKRLGMWALAIGAGVALSTFYIFVVTYQGWDQLAVFARPNRFFMVSYAVLLVWAYRQRANASVHKRLMYLATLYMLGPVLDRAASHFGATPMVFTPLVYWSTFFRHDDRWYLVSQRTWPQTH